jgi:hypothetical protein
MGSSSRKRVQSQLLKVWTVGMMQGDAEEVEGGRVSFAGSHLTMHVRPK